jgi:signal transduction histidine kinase
VVSSELEGHLRFVEEAGRQLKSILQEFHRYTALLVCEPKTQPCDLGQVAKRSLAHLSGVISETGAIVEVGPLPKVEADSQLIEQVLNELLGNAIKYRHPDRATLVVLTGGLNETGGGWWLSVSDNGRGLPEMGRQHLFEPFARLDPDNPRSAGLGLAVCREVAEMHGGTIEAESLDEGSLFTLRVPGVSRAGLAA